MSTSSLRTDQAPAAADRSEDRTPALRRRLTAGGAAGPLLVLALTAVPALVSDFWLFVSTQALVTALAVLSVIVLFRAASLLSLCQASLMGIAAFAMTWTADRWNLPYLAAALCGIGAAAVVGLLVALPALRMRGLELAVLTLSVALAASSLVFSPAAPVKVTPYGAVLRHDGVLGLSFGRPAHLYYLVLVVDAVALAAVVVVARRRTGKTWAALRAGNAAAASVGISVVRTKLFAFALSAVLAGTAGVLFLTVQTTDSGSSFTALASLGLVIGAVLGGLENPLGMFAGGFALRVGPELFKQWNLDGEWLNLILGIVVVVVIVASRGGIKSVMNRG